MLNPKFDSLRVPPFSLAIYLFNGGIRGVVRVATNKREGWDVPPTGRPTYHLHGPHPLPIQIYIRSWHEQREAEAGSSLFSISSLRLTAGDHRTKDRINQSSLPTSSSHSTTSSPSPMQTALSSLSQSPSLTPSTFLSSLSSSSSLALNK